VTDLYNIYSPQNGFNGFEDMSAFNKDDTTQQQERRKSDGVAVKQPVGVPVPAPMAVKIVTSPTTTTTTSDPSQEEKGKNATYSSKTREWEEESFASFKIRAWEDESAASSAVKSIAHESNSNSDEPPQQTNPTTFELCTPTKEILNDLSTSDTSVDHESKTTPVKKKMTDGEDGGNKKVHSSGLSADFKDKKMVAPVIELKASPDDVRLLFATALASPTALFNEESSNVDVNDVNQHIRQMDPSPGETDKFESIRSLDQVFINADHQSASQSPAPAVEEGAAETPPTRTSASFVDEHALMFSSSIDEIQTMVKNLGDSWTPRTELEAIDADTASQSESKYSKSSLPGAKTPEQPESTFWVDLQQNMIYVAGESLLLLSDGFQKSLVCAKDTVETHYPAAERAFLGSKEKGFEMISVAGESLLKVPAGLQKSLVCAKDTVGTHCTPPTVSGCEEQCAALHPLWVSVAQGIDDSASSTKITRDLSRHDSSSSRDSSRAHSFSGDFSGNLSLDCSEIPHTQSLATLDTTVDSESRTRLC
jgi:hypothetical protein